MLYLHYQQYRMDKLYKIIVLFIWLASMNLTVQAQLSSHTPYLANSVRYNPTYAWNNILANKKPKQTLDFTNYPNPATTFTTVSYHLGERSNVVLRVIDLAGKQLAVLIRQQQDAGKQEFYWEFAKNNITSGMYILILQLDNKTYSRKVIVQ